MNDSLRPNKTTWLNLDYDNHHRHFEDFFKFETPFPRNLKLEKPYTIMATWETDLNLSNIHSDVFRIFCQRLYSSQQIQDQLEKVRIKLFQDPPTELEAMELRDQELTLMRQFEELSSLEDWEEYILNVQDILHDYFEVMSNKFLGVVKIGQEEENPERVSIRISIITAYLEILNRFNFVRLAIEHQSHVSICPSCDLKWNQQELQEVCECGLVLRDMSPGVVAVTRASGGSNHANTIVKLMDRFEGRENFKIPSDLFDKMDNYCRLNRLPKAEDIRAGRVPQPSLEDINNILVKVGYSNLYDRSNIIRHEYWGWPYPSLGDKRDQISCWFCKTRSYIENNPSPHRKSKPNINVHFWFITKLVGFDFSVNMFRIPDSVKSRSDHREILQDICRHFKIEPAIELPMFD